jgi:hypothetical protein
MFDLAAVANCPGGCSQTLEWASDRNHQHQELVPLLITMLWDSLPMLTMHFSWPDLKGDSPLLPVLWGTASSCSHASL